MNFRPLTSKYKMRKYFIMYKIVVSVIKWNFFFFFEPTFKKNIYFFLFCNCLLKKF